MLAEIKNLCKRITNSSDTLNAIAKSMSEDHWDVLWVSISDGELSIVTGLKPDE